MLTSQTQDAWALFLDCMEERCSSVEFANWFAPIQKIDRHPDRTTLEVPNIFVQEYLLDNYKEDLALFFPLTPSGDLSIEFVIAKQSPRIQEAPSPITAPLPEPVIKDSFQLNSLYNFENFIEGPSNQFVKSAALGVAMRPGKSYNPLFIHGGVGLGKTHLLHAVGHYVKNNHPKLRIHCITTEGFINDLVENLRNKTLDKMKRFYRSLDVLLVDDIQFLQNRMNFEEEFCNTFESLIHQNKQIIITSDKPPGQLNLSERLTARMEWGLVANIGIPDLETRVAILQYKAEQKGIRLPQKIAFFIAEHIYNNVRQLEGAINRLSAHSKMLGLDVTEESVERTLSELFQLSPSKKVSVENILRSVSLIFEVKISDLKGDCRSKDIAFPRQVAMYLAKELINDSLMKLSSAFGGKTHSTLLHAWKKISGQIEQDETLRRRIDMAKRNLEA
ncbi:MAG: chromosomal replication initiator protein DnaA [Rhabdochlamydiaceae bacterium]|nr:chromosomal replication initiator protein DnaA [Rhabdochlamydiaceae bacterium]